MLQGSSIEKKMLDQNEMLSSSISVSYGMLLWLFFLGNWTLHFLETHMAHQGAGKKGVFMKVKKSVLAGTFHYLPQCTKQKHRSIEM